MKDKLEKIKAACREAIALGEKATAGPWNNHAGETVIYAQCVPMVYTCDGRGFDWAVPNFLGETGAKANARFIAHSRQFSPQAAKALLLSIETFEAYVNGKLGNKALKALQEIINSFPL
jgi:hypothetical protein